MRPRTARIPGCLRNPHTHPARIRPADRPMTVPPPHTPVAPHTSLPDRPPTGPILCRRSLGGATPPPGHQATPILPAADEQAAPAITTRISHNLNLAATRPLTGHQLDRPILTLRSHTPPPTYSPALIQLRPHTPLPPRNRPAAPKSCSPHKHPQNPIIICTEKFL